jgi:2-(1,2-epoxy-1,2-dihydrophenyl)acetyl-CoA isomerase
MTDLVQVEDRDAVRIIAINRPEVRNAISTPVLLLLRKAFKQAAKAEHLRAVILTGRGGAFSAGADVKEWAEFAKGNNPHPEHNWVEEAIGFVQDIARFPKPTIAMMDGPAAGGGLDFALACDFRIASTKARFICAYTRVGFSPDAGGSWLLPRLIGIEATKMFVFTGDTWDAAKALSVGMVTEVVEVDSLEARTMELAQKLASGPTVAIGLAKALIDNAHRRTFHEQLAEEERAGKICGETEDHREGLAAANERRAPKFIGR